MSAACRLRNVRHPDDGSPRRGRRIYLATVRADKLNPNLPNSAWILCWPHSAFSAAILRMSNLSSAGIGRRPMQPLRLDRQRQHAFHPLRCHLSTVSGLTMRSASRQPGKHRQARTQIRRSASSNLGLVLRRLRTSTCCRRQRFSATSSPFGRKKRVIARTNQTQSPPASGH